jgi:hypothetical protein
MWEGMIMESNAVNPDVLKRLQLRIIAAERENFKTQKRKPNEMDRLIREIIEVEVDKDAN